MSIKCGDCLERLAELPNRTIDLVVTSPPYNLRNTTGGQGGGEKNNRWKASPLMKGNDRTYKRKTHAFRGALASKNPRKIEAMMTGGGYDDHGDDMPYAEYVEWQRKVLDECMRVLKDDGAIFYNHKWRPQNKLLQDRSEIVSGFPVRQIIIWKRQGGMNFTNTHFLPTYEVIYMIAKPDFKLLPKANALGDVWSIPQARGNPHPAPFPVEIPLRCIQSCLMPGEAVVLDPFMGSGTTAIAAIRAGVAWVGFEKSQEYCDLAQMRVYQETAQLNLIA